MVSTDPMHWPLSRSIPDCPEAGVNFQRGAQKPQHAACRPGFTLLELVIVLMIAGILASVAIPSFSRYLRWRAVVNAQDAFVFAAARARALAVERGRVIELVADPTTDRVVALNPDGTEAMPAVDFAVDHSVDLVITEGITRICYVPRGFAQPDCSPGLGREVRFSVGGETVQSRINGLGQVDRQ